MSAGPAGPAAPSLAPMPVSARVRRDPLLYALHQLSGWTFAGLVPLHVAGVLLVSYRQRENLLAAMLSGRKRAAAPGDIGPG